MADATQVDDWAVPQDDWIVPAQEKQPSMLERAAEPITSYPQTYRQMNQEAQDQMARGAGQLTSPEGGWDIAKGVGNVGLGALNYVTSPINAGLRTVVGKPLEENLGIPKEYSEFAASLALPGVGLRSAMPPVAAPVGPLSKTQEMAAAAERMGVQIPRAATTESIPLQATSAAVKEVPVVGAPLVRASKEASEGIESAVGRTADALGSGQMYQAGESAKSAIENWITKRSPEIADRLYGWEKTAIDPTVLTELDATRRVAGNILARNQAAMLGPGKAVDEISGALTSPGLSYDGIKRLRTHIGEMMDGGILPEGMSRGELKQIYGALSEDLRRSVLQSGGPDAVRSFDRSNALFSQLRDKQKAVSKLIGVDANAPAEAVTNRLLQMANGKGTGDIARLTMARRAMGPEAWNEVTSAIINKMGRVAEDGEFSGNRFVTAWSNMSDAGRRLLFNSRMDNSTSRAMDDLVTLSKAHKNLLALGNPSGTGRVVTLGGIGAGLIAEPVTMLSSALGGRIFAHVMAQPATARQVSSWAKAATRTLKNPSPLSRMVLARNSAALAESVGKTFGLDPSAVLRGLQGTVPVKAEDDQQ